MTTHTSVLGALDAFWATLRRQAERDPQFAADLAKSLNVPIEIRIETAADVSAALPLLDPVIIAGRGLDEFRKTFSEFKDADLKRIIKTYNYAAAAELTGRGSPKGAALVDILWKGASSRRKRLEDRS